MIKVPSNIQTADSEIVVCGMIWLICALGIICCMNPCCALAWHSYQMETKSSLYKENGFVMQFKITCCSTLYVMGVAVYRWWQYVGECQWCGGRQYVVAGLQYSVMAKSMASLFESGLVLKAFISLAKKLSNIRKKWWIVYPAVRNLPKESLPLLWWCSHNGKESGMNRGRICTSACHEASPTMAEDFNWHPIQLSKDEVGPSLCVLLRHFTNWAAFSPGTIDPYISLLVG